MSKAGGSYKISEGETGLRVCIFFTEGMVAVFPGTNLALEMYIVGGEY